MAVKQVRKMRLPKLSRDFILFVGGLIGILNETFLHVGAERPYLLVVFAGMVGLPVFLYQDEHRVFREEPEKKSTSLNDIAEWLAEHEKEKK